VFLIDGAQANFLIQKESYYQRGCHFVSLTELFSKMADEVSIQKILISIQEYERLKDIEQKYIELQKHRKISGIIFYLST
jgi:hypothetical protein